MAKYQFLTIPASNRQSYTYLDADSPTFTLERNALLAQGFEVEKYRSNFTYVAEEYAQSNAIYAVFSLLVVIGKSLLGRKRRH